MRLAKSRSARLPLLTLLGLFALPATAHAHSAVKGAGDFLSGLFHPLTTPSHVLLIVGLGLLAGRRHPLNLKLPMALFITCSGAALAMAALGRIKSVHPAILICIALGVGALLALDKNPATLPFSALFAIAALVMGLDSAPEPGSAASTTKTVLGNWIALVVLVYDIAIYVSLGGRAKWLKVALQIAGAWLIAIAMLVLAFALRA